MVKRPVTLLAAAKPRAAVAVASALIVSTIAPAALACPYCAAASGRGVVGVTIALGAFLLLPFLVVGYVLRAIRAERAAEARSIEAPKA